MIHGYHFWSGSSIRYEKRKTHKKHRSFATEAQWSTKNDFNGKSVFILVCVDPRCVFCCNRSTCASQRYFVTLSQTVDSHANANTRETAVAATAAAASTAETEPTTNCEPNEMNSIDDHTLQIIPSCSDKQRRSLADANDQNQTTVPYASTQTQRCSLGCIRICLARHTRSVEAVWLEGIASTCEMNQTILVTLFSLQCANK